jgi:hypothetical protein
MDFDIKRSHISALSKLMGNAENAKLSHLQRIDMIAEVLGFKNQAALMATIKAIESKVPATAPAACKTEVAMIFGSEYTSAIDSNERVSDDAFGETRVLTFDTPEEANSYFRGIEDGSGWERYMTLERVGPGLPAREGSYLTALAQDPNLALIDWHNDKMAEFEEDDLGDGPE